MAEINNYFMMLYNIDCSGKIEKKNGLSYLSWPWAWAEAKKLYPESTYRIIDNADGWNYWTDGRTCWVKTGVTVNGIEHIEELPVMDHRNRSIPLEQITSMDVNKAIQRSLTKALARHGLGLYIYAGEDLPEEAKLEAEAAPPTMGQRKDRPRTPKVSGRVTAGEEETVTGKYGKEYPKRFMEAFNMEVDGYRLGLLYSKDRATFNDLGKIGPSDVQQACAIIASYYMRGDKQNE